MEHFGISIVEAMASGCLPVVHNSGGPPEFVPDQYRYNTFQEAAEIVDAVIDQWTPELGYKMARIAERFSEENFSKRFMQLFNEYFDNFLNERAYHKRARNPPECKQTFREKMM